MNVIFAEGLGIDKIKVMGPKSHHTSHCMLYIAHNRELKVEITNPDFELGIGVLIILEN